jgi:uncharacterized protein YigE (DUF2233 family)
MIPFARFLAALAFIAFGSVAAGEPCRSESFKGADYTVCSFDLQKDDLRLFWKDSSGGPYKTFDALAVGLKVQGLTLAFAMNGGMYGDDFSPTGLHIEEGRELAPANTKSVPGTGAAVPNFYKKPNGVFFVGEGEAGVMATEAFLSAKPSARFATQSGPMLVVDGRIHPAFIEGSTDLKPRDGVGVSSPTEVHFAITEGRVNFYDFARFFRDRLGCRNALFFDGGTAPGLYAPEHNRNDAPGHGGYGPIVGVVK